VAAGDAVIGLASSGPHSNGYSLVRRILERDPGAAARDLDGVPLADRLMMPTRLYVKSVLALIAACEVHGLAHITGGGLPGNVERVLPPTADACITAGSWPRPAVFEWLQAMGRVADDEMYRTFNCGIGMVVVVPRADAERARRLLAAAGETVHVIGEIRPGTGQVRITP